MKTSKSGGEPSEPSESSRPCEASFDHPASGQQHRAAVSPSDALQLRAGCLLLGGFDRGRAGVALVNIGDLDGVAGHRLHLFGQRCHLRAVGRHDGQRQQVAECIDRDVHLRPFAALGPIVAGSCAALRGRLQRAAIDAHCRRLALALGPLARNLPHIGHQHRKAARLDPAPYLLVHRDPASNIVSTNSHSSVPHITGVSHADPYPYLHAAHQNRASKEPASVQSS